ncbi:MAG: hypothetical protein Q9218_002845 [Villophora microphyllina]
MHLSAVMHLATHALVFGASFAAAASIESLLHRANQTAVICSTLAKTFPGQIELPGSSNYTTETSSYWSFRDYLHPYCVWAPTKSTDLARGVKILADSNTHFAVRSGGHSPIAGTANIDEGVLIVTTGFDVMKVVPAPNPLGAQYFSMGAGKRWGQAYDFLVPQGLNIVGGRVWPVGSGALLGGGISYLGYKHGWASDNVLNFELVTGKGEVLQVNNKTYPDLFWALKGGSNNYGIVTRYDMKTYPQGKVFGGTIVYKPENTQDYLDAYQAWINPGGGAEDNNAAIMPNVNYSPLTKQSVATWVGIHNAPENNPRTFENFTKIPSTTSAVGVTTFDEIVNQSKGYGGTIARGNWFATAISFYNDTLNYQYKTFISTADALLAGLNVTIGWTSEPVTTSFLEASRQAGGDAMDLDPQRGSFHVVLCYAFWADENLDARMEDYLQTLIRNMDVGSKESGHYYPFIWLNNAGDTQHPFELYGYGKSLPRMKEVARRYDPRGVFQRLVPGFKLDGPMLP